MTANTKKIWLGVLSLSSLIVTFSELSRLGFTHTATMGYGAVIVYCVSYGFSGALVGAFISLLGMLGARVVGGKAIFPFVPMLSVWVLFQVAAYYAIFKH